MTIKLTYNNMTKNPAEIRVGGVYKIMSFDNILREAPTEYKLLPDIDTGWPGNMDSSIRLYHGWRGTTNNIEANALGVFKVLDIVRQKNGLYRIKLSADLHPDWE